MRKSIWYVVVLVAMMAGLFMLPAQGSAKSVYIGGTMSLTGPYAEDSAAVLAGFEDYVKYVNDTKMMAPWRKEKWPSDIPVELLWRDDELKPAKALSIYEELKAKGILVYRASGSPIALALKDRLKQDNMGATSMSTGSFLMTPPATIFTYYPIYTDDLAAVADWFKKNWKESRKPRVAYLTADNSMGKSIEIPEMEAYLKKEGFDFVGIQYVPLVPTSPPTTQLMWIKQNKVDLALGIMINPGAQSTEKEMGRLDMGPNLAYKITFAVGTPAHIQIFADDMKDLGDGFVVSGDYPPWEATSYPAIKWMIDLQKKYRPGKFVRNVQYMGGMVEAMTQLEALRLALLKTPVDKLKPADVLNDGFYKIKNLDVGGIVTPLTYGPGKIEGVDLVRVDQMVKGKIVHRGDFPCRHIYAH
jgi:branched-chain amino acid transport system substrate-binding protein